MKTTFATAAAALLALILIWTSSAAQQTAHTSEPPENDGASVTTSSPDLAGSSKIRIVRLSQVHGQVQFDRNIGSGFERAVPNLPVTEGAKLQTVSGIAEVEFEDGSTLRIAPNGLIGFPRLELLSSGAKATTVNVVRGAVYLSRANTKGNDISLTFGREEITPTPASHIRLEVEPADAKLAVLAGSAQVDKPSGVAAAGKKTTLTFDLAGESQPTLAKNVSRDPSDAWDRDAAEYQKRYGTASAFTGSPGSYGAADMNYYGSFLNTPGCGAIWRPYFVSAAWDPFSNGDWAWYPGAGYSWVSPYPWGWMPYHYGAWSMCPGIGWAWQPGGAWMGLSNIGVIPSRLGGPGGVVQPPPSPSRVPTPGRSALVSVNLRPLAVSQDNGRDTFVFRNESAGMGVPRGSLGDLKSFSGQAERQGFVSAPVSFASDRARQARIGPPDLSLRQAPRIGEESSSRSFEPGFRGSGEYHGSGSSVGASSSGAGRGH